MHSCEVASPVRVPAQVTPPSTRTLRVALLGYGVVGREVATLLQHHEQDLTARVAARLQLCGIAVRDLAKARAYATAHGIDPHLITDDPNALVRQGPDVVVELMGGIEPARSLLLEAIASGASVVTANKALLATHGEQVFSAAEAAGVDVAYEAAVAGAIPLLRPLRESLVGDQVQHVLGIVNGTTNFILTRMDEQAMSYSDALLLAQQAGYAEADPSADVEGHDAAAKAAILAGLAFHSSVTRDQVACEGITSLTARDMAHAQQRDSVIKLLAVAERIDEQGISVRVHPAMVPRHHPLASVRDAFNAVYVQADAAGELMFYGRGAGGVPTASAVLGDLVAIGRHRVQGSHGPRHSTYAGLPVVDAGLARSAYHLHLEVADLPGVLAAVAATFAEQGVSLATVRQTPDVQAPPEQTQSASLLLVTHQASAAALSTTVAALKQLAVVRHVHNVIPVLE